MKDSGATCIDDEIMFFVSIQQPVVQRHILVHDGAEVLPTVYIVGTCTHQSIRQHPLSLTTLLGSGAYTIITSGHNSFVTNVK